MEPSHSFRLLVKECAPSERLSIPIAQKAKKKKKK